MHRVTQIRKPTCEQGLLSTMVAHLLLGRETAPRTRAAIDVLPQQRNSVSLHGLDEIVGSSGLESSGYVLLAAFAGHDCAEAGSA